MKRFNRAALLHWKTVENAAIDQGQWNTRRRDFYAVPTRGSDVVQAADLRPQSGVLAEGSFVRWLHDRRSCRLSLRREPMPSIAHGPNQAKQSPGRLAWAFYRNAMRSGQIPPALAVERIPLLPEGESTKKDGPISVASLAVRWNLKLEEMDALLVRIHVTPLNGLVLEEVVLSAFAAHQLQGLASVDRVT